MRILLLVLPVLLLLGGCTGLMLGGASGGNAAPPGTGAVTANDAAITAAVRNQLVSSPSLAGNRISVSTRAGRVTLAGTVASYAERQRAADLASRIDAVVSVDNRIRVAR